MILPVLMAYDQPMSSERPSAEQNPHETTAFAAELNEETSTVDLHEMTVDEAVYALDSAVNHAFMEGEEAIRIIHGRGEGRLRQAVQDHLRGQTELVAYFRDSHAPGQTGGVTIAVLHSKMPFASPHKSVPE